MMFYRCESCGAGYPRDTDRWRCSCGAPFDLAAQPSFERACIDSCEQSLWRYAAMLPAGLSEQRVSYREGWTPLLPAPALGHGLHLKLEFMFPSGSFKDRGTTV